jgi:hypothetical protein
MFEGSILALQTTCQVYLVSLAVVKAMGQEEEMSAQINLCFLRQRQK